MVPVESGEASFRLAREIPPTPILHPANPPSRPRKLYLPTFDCDNPEGWILKTESFFALNRLTKTEKVKAAVIFSEWDALLWY